MVYSNDNDTISIYCISLLHTRCGYCDFNTYAGINPHPDNTSAFVQNSVGSFGLPPIAGSDVFFGGGTPSCSFRIRRNHYRTANDSFDMLPGAEISLEAIPARFIRVYAVLFDWE